MQGGVCRGFGSVLSATLVLAACGQSQSNLNADGGSGASGGTAGGCGTAPPLEDWATAPLVELPTRVEGTLCDTEDRLAVAVPGVVADRAVEPIGIHLREGSGSYSISLFDVDGAALVPLTGIGETHVFSLDADEPDLFFMGRHHATGDNRVVVELVGSPGRVAIELSRPELAPNAVCSGEYESLPASTPPRALPTVLETELCNARDSRVWAVEVAAERKVTVTLENPLAIDLFSLNVYSTEGDAYAELPVSEGVTRARLGLIGAPSLSFTPIESGIVGFSASVGFSRGDGIRLRVEQP